MAERCTIQLTRKARPNRTFNILASAFKLDSAGNVVPLLPADVSAMSYTIYQRLDYLPDEITTGSQITGSGSFVAAQVLSNTMLTGSGWPLASLPGYPAGFNLNLPIPGSYIPTAGVVYELQLSTTLTSSLQFDDWFTFSTLDVP